MSSRRYPPAPIDAAKNPDDDENAFHDTVTTTLSPTSTSDSFNADSMVTARSRHSSSGAISPLATESAPLLSGGDADDEENKAQCVVHMIARQDVVTIDMHGADDVEER